MRPIIDNLEQLIDSDEEERYKDEEELHAKIDELFSRGLIETEAMNFIRGRSFVNTYLIIDEGSEHDTKTGNRYYYPCRKRNESNSSWRSEADR